MTPFFWGASLAFAGLTYYAAMPLTLREKACRVIVSDLSLFSSLCPTLVSPSLSTLFFNKCFRLLGDSVEISLD